MKKTCEWFKLWVCQSESLRRDRHADYKEVHSRGMEQIVNIIPTCYKFFLLWDL